MSHNRLLSAYSVGRQYRPRKVGRLTSASKRLMGLSSGITGGFLVESSDVSWLKLSKTAECIEQKLSA